MKHLTPTPQTPPLVIRDPKTRKRVPPEGITVDEQEPFWARRLADGSMIATDPPIKPNKTRTSEA